MGLPALLLRELSDDEAAVVAVVAVAAFFAAAAALALALLAAEDLTLESAVGPLAEPLRCVARAGISVVGVWGVCEDEAEDPSEDDIDGGDEDELAMAAAADAVPAEEEAA